MTIELRGRDLVDEHGRRYLLRGVNLGADAKIPVRPDGSTHRVDGFYDHRSVSFVGRPFPLEEADEHFARLRRWGLTFLRFLVTWEAIEHAGPGIHDQDYLDYVEAIVRKAGEHGLLLFIDPHQDVWSRWSGGDGAPGWTLEAAGFDLRHLEETAAAVLHQERGDAYPRMIWPTNSSKLAAATMFTVFFAGDDFAPHAEVDGEPLQQYLQRHYLGAVQALARRVAGLDHVIGYDVMNEPFWGYIGWDDLSRARAVVEAGLLPSPFESMCLGDGIPRHIDEWRRGVLGPRRIARRLVNPGRARAWRDGADCIWRRHGVWDVDSRGEPRLLRPDYFTRVGERRVDFGRDYYRPFANRFAAAVRAVHPGALVFIEPQPLTAPPAWRPEDAGGIVYAPHWYDGATLYLKRYLGWLGYDEESGRIVLTPGRIRASFARQLRRLKAQGDGLAGGMPTVIGEIGIPFDLNGRRAYRTGDFRAQIAAMNRSMRAVEDNLLHCTIWNYTAINDNEHGDHWNGEDLSIYSPSQRGGRDDPDAGGRALEAVVRPYPRLVAGELLRLWFDPRSGRFELRFRHDPAVQADTELFLPALHYPRGCRVEVSDGTYELDAEASTLRYRHGHDREIHTIRLRP